MTATVWSSEYDHELHVALNLARNAGAAILEYYNSPIEVLEKFDRDEREPVTQADKVANELIVTGLQNEFPADGILAEESVDTARRLSHRVRPPRWTAPGRAAGPPRKS